MGWQTIADYKGLGSVVSSPSGVRGGAQAEIGYWCILSLKNECDDKFDIFCHFYSAYITRLLQVYFSQRMLQVGGYKLPPSSISGSVPARDEIPTIFVRKFFRRTPPSRIWHFFTCKYKMADENRK